MLRVPTMLTTLGAFRLASPLMKSNTGPSFAVLQAHGRIILVEKETGFDAVLLNEEQLLFGTIKDFVV
jgi:hypothetical protein